MDEQVRSQKIYKNYGIGVPQFWSLDKNDAANSDGRIHRSIWNLNYWSHKAQIRLQIIHNVYNQNLLKPLVIV